MEGSRKSPACEASEQPDEASMFKSCSRADRIDERYTKRPLVANRNTFLVYYGSIPLHVNSDWTVRFLLVSKTYGAFTSLWWHCVDHTLYIPALLDTDVGGRGLLWPRIHVEVGSITPEQKPWAPRCFSYTSCPSAIQPAVPLGEAAPPARSWSDDGIGAELQLFHDDLRAPQGINLCFYRQKKPKQNHHPNWSSILPRHENIKGLCVKSIFTQT